MTASTTIDSQVIDGVTYYQATSRGVSYVAHEICGKWFVSSHRLALGPRHIGGGRYYDDVAAVAAGCKAFAGLDVLLQADAIAN
jgi:hypothetical protein